MRSNSPLRASLARFAGLILLAGPMAWGAPARAQSCQLAGDIAQLSITSGGVQTLTLSSTPQFAGERWYMLGSFAGTQPGIPMFTEAGLFLNPDRYFYLTYRGRSPILRAGSHDFLGGVSGTFDAAGMATLQVAVAPGAYAYLIGRTVHHGFYRTSPATLLPDCGSNTVALTFVP